MKKFILAAILTLAVGLVGSFADSQPKLNSTKVIGNPQPLSAIGTSSIAKNMVLIEGGSFQMGTNGNSRGFQAAVSSFYMSKYEVTVGEFRSFVNATGYKTTGEMYKKNEIYYYNSSGKMAKDKNSKISSWVNSYIIDQGESHPVVLISWYDAIEYCNWLSLQEGLTPAYTINLVKNKLDIVWDRSANGYRLPTEAEWEYACRAGTTTTYYYGDTPDVNTGWYRDNNDYVTHPVGQMPPNLWGLYDMQGNVMEWVWDRYSTTFPTSPQVDTYGSVSGSSNTRLKKGGSFFFYAKDGLSNFRYGWNYDGGSNDGGFRIVRN
jgi:formylglycine-generating enzyme required for sulfatase activity